MVVIRVFAIAMVVLTALYVCLSLYSRAARRDRLKAEWADGDHDGDMDTFVKEGLVDYDKSLRKRLILGVYVIPCLIVGLLIYFVNYA